MYLLTTLDMMSYTLRNSSFSPGIQELIWHLYAIDRLGHKITVQRSQNVKSVFAHPKIVLECTAIVPKYVLRHFKVSQDFVLTLEALISARGEDSIIVGRLEP